MFLDKQNNKETSIKKEIVKKIEDIELISDEKQIDEEDALINFTIEDIEYLLDMLSIDRNKEYTDWLNVGICLHNINKNYLLMWIKWSKKSDKYDDGKCEEKWKTFRKKKDSLKIGSLLYWAKSDNMDKYCNFIKRKKMNGIIISKFPKNDLILGDTVIVDDKCNYTHLRNKE